jgi:hypothetical protein
MDDKDGRKASTGTYRVRGMSRDLHRAARLRATSEGTTLRCVIVRALQAYSAETWSPPDAAISSRKTGSDRDSTWVGDGEVCSRGSGHGQ